MRQTELRLTDADRATVDEIRSKGVHHAREVNRAHALSCLDRGVPEAQILEVLGMGRTALCELARHTCKPVSSLQSSTLRARGDRGSTTPMPRRG